jgi:hypothetical protein
MFSENPQTKINSLQGLLNAERKASAGLKASVESLTSQLMEKEVAHRENIREISRMAHEKEDVVFKLVSDRCEALSPGSSSCIMHTSPISCSPFAWFILMLSPVSFLCGNECIWPSAFAHHLNGQSILV